MSKLRNYQNTNIAMQVGSEYLQDSNKGFELLTQLISAPEKIEDLSQELEQLEKLIRHDFLEISKLQKMPNEAEMYENLKKALEDLKDLTEFSALANKNVVAVGGGFSSGKSRFLNSIVNEELLPVETTPSTAIPSFISKGNQETIYALNTFNTRISLDRQAVQAISHDFKNKYNVSFSHIIKNIVLETPAFSYENIVLLDTPGYSKPDGLEKGSNTDEMIARRHLSQADHLLWVLEAPKGSISDMDIQFIRSLEFEGEIFVIINKADQKPPGEIPSIMETVQKQLEDADINYSGLLAYNSAARENREVRGDSVVEFLQRINEKIKYKNVKQNFRRIFCNLIQFNQQEIVSLREILKLLNELYLNHVESMVDTDSFRLKELTDLRKKNIKSLQIVISKFEDLQEQVERLVDKIMQHIKVEEENRSDIGVVASANNLPENVIANLTEGTLLQGKVVKVNIFGVYVDCGWCNTVMVYKEDIEAKYTAKQDVVFAVDSECQVEVLKVSRKDKSANMIIIPKMEG